MSLIKDESFLAALRARLDQDARKQPLPAQEKPPASTRGQFRPDTVNIIVEEVSTLKVSDATEIDLTNYYGISYLNLEVLNCTRWFEAKRQGLEVKDYEPEPPLGLSLRPDAVGLVVEDIAKHKAAGATAIDLLVGVSADKNIARLMRWFEAKRQGLEVQDFEPPGFPKGAPSPPRAIPQRTMQQSMRPSSRLRPQRPQLRS